MSLPYTVALPITTSVYRLTITQAETTQPTNIPGDPTAILVDFRDKFHKYLQGDVASNIVYASNPVAASGTVTFSSVAAADTVTIGATVFTGSNNPTTAVQFQTNAEPSAAADKVAAASLASKITANTTTGLVVAGSNVAGTAVVTVTALVPGLIGNFYPIAISAHGSVSGSGLLTSGSDGTVAVISQGL